LPWTGPGGSKRVSVGVTLVERHAVLQAERDRDREVVEQRAQRRAFLVHVDEDLADRRIRRCAGAGRLAADHGTSGCSAAVGHALALAHDRHALDHPLTTFSARAEARAAAGFSMKASMTSSSSSSSAINCDCSGCELCGRRGRAR
jgi:hypothetical protein